MRLAALAVGLLGALLYAAAVHRLGQVPHNSISKEMQVALPRFIQVALTGGDRYLAANIATWRSLVASLERMEKDNYAIQARLQRDAAWLNPGQEDNYYVAAAVLPWAGELDAAQDVLWRASEARQFDWQPIFFYAFNVYQFKKDSVTAAKLLHEGSRRPMSETNHYMFEQIAASWYEKGYSPDVALRIVENMAQNARSSGFRKFLEARAGRLQTLLDLREATTQFKAREGRSPRALAELVYAGLIATIPADPFGMGFELDESGEPVFKRPGGQGR
jgi:hypothetical protein